jgi:hypothetical protein
LDYYLQTGKKKKRKRDAKERTWVMGAKGTLARSSFKLNIVNRERKRENDMASEKKDDDGPC